MRIIRNTVDQRRNWALRPEDAQQGGAGVDDPSSNRELGTVEYFAEGKSLVISQTAEVLVQIEELLMELRQTKKFQENK
jgi:hypothetical protein